MAVTFHNFTQTAGPASVGTKTVLHTVSAAEAVVLVYTFANAATSISAVGANGFSLTRLGHISASASRMEVWGLTAPPVATLSISINTVAASLDFAVAVVSYLGARFVGGSPFGTVVAGSAQGVANVAFSVSSTTTDVVSYGFGVSGAPATTITTGNNRGSATTTAVGRMVIGDVTGAATISISATAATANTWAFLAVPIVASGTETTTIRFDNAAVSSTSTNRNSMGLLLTATAGAVLIVNVFFGGSQISAVHVNTNQLTAKGTSISWGASARAGQFWVLTAPAAGILTISAEVAGANTVVLGMAAVTYTGHKTTGDPFGATVTFGSATQVNTTTLSVSSTVGDKVVFAYQFDFSPGIASAGPGMSQRVASQAADWPSFIIFDAPGAPAVTGVAKASATNTTNWGMFALNLIQSGPASFISGIAAFTDVHDIFSASGYNIVSGRLSATDVTDKFSASGNTGAVTARLSATEATDRFSATGYVIVSGRLSATGAADIFSASGNMGAVTARLSATDAPDKFSASGYVIVTGRLSATDAADRFSASGYVIVQGRLSATDAPDRFSASGYVIVQGRLSATDIADRFSASGYVTAAATFTTGTVSFTDPADSFSASGYTVVSGRLSATDVTDKFSASGYVIVQGLLSATDAVDTFFASGSTTGAVTPVVVTTPDTTGGGGHKEKKTEYFRADDAFWDAREKYLRSLQPAISAEPEPAPLPADISPATVSYIDPSILASYQATRFQIVNAIHEAPNMRQLRSHGRRLLEVNARIADQKRQQLLFDEFNRQARTARQAKRKKDIKRIKRRILLLAAARAAVTLSTVISKL